jgi:anti-sigma-K factor RskA
VSGCRTHGHLVGGYVLGALDPGEEAAMRRHLQECAECAREQAELQGLPALLDRVEPAAAPAPALLPALEEAVVDRVARERRSRKPAPEVARGRRRRPALRLLAAAGAVLAAGAALVLVVLPGGAEGVYARAHLRGHAASAFAEVQEVDAGTRVRLRAQGLDRRRVAVYELWCIRTDGRWVSAGTFHARGGRADVELTAAVHPGDYHRMVVKRRTGEGGGGPAVLEGTLVY